MHKTIKNLLFLGYIICAILFLGIAVAAFIIKPSERIFISVVILLPIIGSFGVYIWLYKQELQQKFVGRIIGTLTCLIFCIIGVYHFPKIPKGSAERLIDGFFIFLFASGAILFLLGKRPDGKK